MSKLQTLFTLCYPSITEADRLFIDEFRREHDIPFRDVVAPHFTMVFGCSDVPITAYREHVVEVAHSQAVINFSLRYAMLGNDDSNSNYYVFLVPDEGYSGISKLHDNLYQGPLASALRLDIPYIPHIGIATIPDAVRVKALCDQLNTKGINIHGQINAITVSSYNGSKITDLESFPCKT
jgi:2'-5' RNA ligase superfamily